MVGSIALNIGRKVGVVFVGKITLAPPSGEVWILECDEIPGSSGMQEAYFIVRWRGNVETGRWNIQQIAGFKYLTEDN